MIAQWIITSMQTPWLIGLYIVILSVVSLWAVMGIQDQADTDLLHG